MARQRLGARTARPAGAQAASGLISPPQAVHLDRAEFTPPDSCKPTVTIVLLRRCGKIEAGVGKIRRLLAWDTT